MATMEATDVWVLMEMMAQEDQRDTEEILDSTVSMDWTVHEDQSEHVVHEAEMALMVWTEPMVWMGNQDVMVWMDTTDTQELMELMVPWDQSENGDQEGQTDAMAPQDWMELMVVMELQVHQDVMVRMVVQETQDQEAHKERMVKLASTSRPLSRDTLMRMLF